MSIPERIGEWEYYSRLEEGFNFPLFCRRKVVSIGIECNEEVILDQNQLCSGKDFMQLGTVKVSSDHNLLAFTVDPVGDETFSATIKDLRNGQIIIDDIIVGVNNVEWGSYASEGKYVLYYTKSNF